MQKKWQGEKLNIQGRMLLIIKIKALKTKLFLAIVILPITCYCLLCFLVETPDAKEKLDLFFEYFNNLPDWYVWLTVGIFGSIYGLKTRIRFI
jgi:uncharacterized protein involved in cysteine biosynthesis